MIRQIVALTASCLLIGCASVATQTNWDPDADLAAYQTYLIESKSKLPPHLARRIEQALQQNLQRAGLSASETPDVTVRFYTVVNDGLQVTETATPTLVTFRRGVTVWNTYDTEVRAITEGTLLVDMVDTSSNRLVWEGSAHGIVSRGETARNQKKIDQAVAKMFASFASASLERN